MKTITIIFRAVCIFLYTAILVLASATLPAAEPEHPDFTGVWTTYRDPDQPQTSGFGAPRPGLPFTEEGQRRVDEYRQLLGPEQANPGAYCVDYGVPTMMEMPGFYPLEFIHKPNQLTIIYEVENETRRIYIGDRQLPPEQRIPSRAGYSAAQWEGDTLVVKTTDFLDMVDQGGHPFSDQASIDETFSMETTANGTRVLTYTSTINDPIYYTEPVVIQRKYEPLKDGFILPYRCPDEFWYELLDMRRDQLQAGEEVDIRMSDVYEAREAKE